MPEKSEFAKEGNVGWLVDRVPMPIWNAFTRFKKKERAGNSRNLYRLNRNGKED